MVGGQVDFACGDIGSFIAQLQAGTIKAIAIASPERADIINDVPTTKEGGLADVQASSWNAIFAPKNLPQDIQARLNDALAKALSDSGTRERLLHIGSVIPGTADQTPQALQTLVESEVVRWSSVLKVAGVTAN